MFHNITTKQIACVSRFVTGTRSRPTVVRPSSGTVCVTKLRLREPRRTISVLSDNDDVVDSIVICDKRVFG
jgi:hypothetical protein